MKDQKKQGILISYLNIVLSTLVNIVLTPILISFLTDEGYSVYRIIRSFAGPLAMLNLGVSTVVARNIAKFIVSEHKDYRENENKCAIAIIISVAMGLLIMFAGYMMQMLIPEIYGNTFSKESIRLAQQMLLVFSATTAVHIITEPFRGIIIGHGRFVLYHGSQTLQYILRFLTIYFLVKSGHNALSIAIVDLVLSIVILLVYYVYDSFVLHQRIRFYYIDKKTVSEFSSFALAILLQALVNQVNNNLDITILGAVEPAGIITMYSAALTIYSVYNMLISVFIGVYLPQATQLVENKANGEQLTDFVIKPGRVQAMLAMCIIGGFAIVGKDFISIWIGSQYINAYYVALFLMIPATIPLVENVAIVILDAKLKLFFRSVTLIIMVVVNILLTLILVRFFGFWGALVGTVISLILGHGILMNIYYKTQIQLNVFRMFKEIFSGTLWVGIVAIICCVPISLFLNGTLYAVLIKGVAFILIYCVGMFFFGLRQDEKEYLKKIFARLKK